MILVTDVLMEYDFWPVLIHIYYGVLTTFPGTELGTRDSMENKVRPDPWFLGI